MQLLVSLVSVMIWLPSWIGLSAEDLDLDSAFEVMDATDVEGSVSSTFLPGSQSISSPQVLNVNIEPSAPSKASKIRKDTYVWGKTKSASFGDYRVKIGLGVPEFDNDLKYYSELYGSESRYPILKIDKIFYESWVMIGGSFGVGYYKDIGSAAKNIQPEANDVDPNEGLELTLIPVQLTFLASMPVGLGKLVILDLWAGWENLYVQERRFFDVEIEDDGGSEGEDEINKGHNDGTVLGIALNINMDWMESRSNWALRALGFQSVYFTPFIEFSATSNGRMGPFSRQVVGGMFSFEGI